MKALAAFLFALLLPLAACATSPSEVRTDTVTSSIDGVSRTLTVTFTADDILAVYAAPVADTFQPTAAAWLDELNRTAVDVEFAATATFDEIAADIGAAIGVADSTPYPPYYAAFIHQYKSALRICYDSAFFRAAMERAENDQVRLATTGVYHTLRAACADQYTDAYIEMERIAHPLR